MFEFERNQVHSRGHETSPSFADRGLSWKSHPDLRHVDALCVDVAARPRGKRYPADKLKSLYAEGMQMPQSHFLLDVNGDNSDPVGPRL